MEIFLTLLSGIGWIIVYEECIRLGIKQKTYTMPFWALALNITWEAIYTYSDLFLGAHGEMTGMLIAQEIVNVFWVGFDCVILYTYFKYGKKEWPKQISENHFVPYSLLVLVCSAALVKSATPKWGGAFGACARFEWELITPVVRSSNSAYTVGSFFSTVQSSQTAAKPPRETRR